MISCLNYFKQEFLFPCSAFLLINFETQIPKNEEMITVSVVNYQLPYFLLQTCFATIV